MPLKTNAAVTTPLGTQVEEIELREPGPHDVVVRIEGANVSIIEAIPDTPPDLPAGGPPPGMPDLPAGMPDLPQFPPNVVHGHAGVAVVERTGPAVSRVKAGDRVLMTSTPNCDVCYYCRRGRPDHCAEMVGGALFAHRLDGAEVHANGAVGCFAEMSVIPETQLTPVTTDLPADQLALIANPVATGVGAARVIAPVQPGSTVAVVGCGPVGLSYIQAARLSLAERIIAIDPLPHRRQAALRFGATTVIDPAETDPVQAVRDLTEDHGGMVPRGADYTFEAAGDARAVEQAWAMARMTGDVTLAGAGTAGSGGLGASASFPVMLFSIGGGKTVHTCQWGGILQRRDFPWLIRLAERGQLDVAAMAERSYPLTDIGTALKDVADRAVIGATLLPGT